MKVVSVFSLGVALLLQGAVALAQSSQSPRPADLVAEWAVRARDRRRRCRPGWRVRDVRACRLVSRR